MPRSRHQSWPVSLFVCLVCILCNNHNSLRAEEPEAPASLLDELKSSDYDIRRAATDKLAQLGDKARSILEQALTSDDLETRETALRLIGKLDKSEIQIGAFDRDGKPVVGAEADIQIYRADQRNWSEPQSKSVVFDEHGQAKITGMVPGGINLNFTWRKWGTGEPNNFHSLRLARGSNPMIVQLSKGGTYTGKVSDSDGKALKDVTILLYRDLWLDSDLLDLQLACYENRVQNIQTALTNAEGKFKLDNVPDGAYQVVARLNDYATTLGEPVRIHENEVSTAPSVIKLEKRPAGKIQFVLMAPVEKKQVHTSKKDQKKDGDKDKKEEVKKEPAKKDDVKKDDPKKPDQKEDVAHDSEDLQPLKKTRVQTNLELVYSGPRATELRKTAARLKMQVDMQRQNVPPESDDSGKITLEDIKPGKYTLTIRNGNQRTWIQKEINVISGQVTDLGKLNPDPCGSITGKLNLGGKEVRNVRVVAYRQDDEGNSIRDLRFRFGYNNENSTSVQNDGKYELKNLLPGTYWLSIVRQGKPLNIYGIVVTAGKATVAPDAELPAAAAKTQELIKGAVTYPDGKPAAGATVVLSWSGFWQWNSHTWPTNCDEEGRFQFSVGGQDFSKPHSIKFSAPGHKAFLLNLEHGDVNYSDIKIKLEKQEYGNLHVKVIDDAGNPVTGATIRPAIARVNYYRQTPGELKAETNPSGEARLTGLAEGSRHFQVTCDGYYVNGEIKADISANTEKRITVTLKRGLTLKGHVELPEGASPANVIALLADKVSSVNDKREFQFTGLAPGEYKLFAHGPALTESEKVNVSVKSGVENENVSIKLVRTTGTVLHVSPDLHGYTASLLPPKSWNPETSGDFMVWPTSGVHGTVDANGRVEIWGAAPGTYDVLLSKGQSQYEYVYYWAQPPGKKCTISPIATGIQINPMRSVSELATSRARDIEISSGKASLSGKIISEAASQLPPNLGMLYLKLVGENSSGLLTFSYPNELSKPVTEEPAVIGTPPPVSPDSVPGSFVFEGVKPGEYKLYIQYQPYRQNPENSPETKKPAPVPARTFVIKEGEQMDLGSLSFVPNESALDNAKLSDENQAEPEDQVPFFQP